MTADRRLLRPEESPRHGYRLDGRSLVSVTTVISTVLRSPQLEEWLKRAGRQADAIRDEAAAFGRSIDAALTAYLLGRDLVPLDMPAAWAATVEAGRRWIDENVAEVLAVQEPVCSVRYGYAGKPDLYCRHKRRRGAALIVDWKATGGVYWSHLLQTAAYRQAAVETYGDRPAERLVLHFDKDQPGVVREHWLRQHSRDFAGFTYCLGLYRIMQGGM